MIFGVSVFLVLKSIFPSVDWSDLPRHGSATGAHRHCQRCAGAYYYTSVRCPNTTLEKSHYDPSCPNSSHIPASFPAFSIAISKLLAVLVLAALLSCYLCHS